jgi:hypothetical protein
MYMLNYFHKTMGSGKQKEAGNAPGFQAYETPTSESANIAY